MINIAGNVRSDTYLKRVSIDRIINPVNRIFIKRSETKLDDLRKLFENKIDFDLLDGDQILFLVSIINTLDVLKYQVLLKDQEVTNLLMV